MHLTKMRCAICSLGTSAGNRFSITSSSSCRGYNKNNAFCKSTENFNVHYHNKHHSMYITCLLHNSMYITCLLHHSMYITCLLHHSLYITCLLHLQHILIMINHLLGEHLNMLTKMYVVITVNTYYMIKPYKNICITNHKCGNHHFLAF